MTPRTIEEIRQRATDLNNNHSHLVQKETELERKVDNYWERDEDESSIDILEDLLEEVESDRKWTEITLEALEWVLGECDVRPELQMEAENDQIRATNQEESSDGKRNQEASTV